MGMHLNENNRWVKKAALIPWDGIENLSQPWVRPIVRGKAGKPVEFGAKLDISVVNGFTRLEYLSFDAYNEATTSQQTI